MLVWNGAWRLHLCNHGTVCVRCWCGCAWCGSTSAPGVRQLMLGSACALLLCCCAHVDRVPPSGHAPDGCWQQLVLALSCMSCIQALWPCPSPVRLIAILAAVRLQCSLAPMLCAVSFRWSARSFWQLLSGQASLCMRVFVHPVWLVVLKCGRQNNSGCAASRGLGSWGILEGVLGVTGTALWFGGPVNVPRGYQEGCNTDWHLDVPR